MNGVMESQASGGRPTPHSQHSTPPAVIEKKKTSRQTSQESRTSSHHTTPHRAQMRETATSPDGPFREYQEREKEFQVDFPIEKPTPRQKTKIVYDLGSPQMNTQGINASIPVTTDKYTYTITSVLSSMSNQNNSADSPLSSPTSGSKRPISSYKIIQPNPNPKIGKISCI